ncbi:MAG: universal stress protein [Acidimicrobiales bacterium]|nr:universal stress protein [Acidimicrobiales bacterium]
MRRIVVGSDGSPGGRLAVEWAAELAAQAGAEVILVHAFEPLAELEHATPPVDFHAIKELRVAEVRSEWCRPFAERGVLHRSSVIESDPVYALRKICGEEGADLVVIGSHGRSGWKEKIFGSVATTLLANLPCPVAIVPLRPD